MLCLTAEPPLRLLSVQELRSLVMVFWDADAEKRPSFEDIIVKLEDMLKTLPKHSHFNKANDGDCCAVQ